MANQPPPDDPPTPPSNNGRAHTEQPPSGRLSTFASLGYRNYRFLWFGQSSAAASMWMEMIALPWLVLQLTGSPVHVGAVIAIRTIPMLVFGVWAGVLVDWFDRRWILTGTKLGLLVVTGVFAVLLLTDSIQIWHAYAASAGRGFFMSFDQPARQSLTADVVPRPLVTNAVALLSSTQNVMRIAGTAMSGFIIAAFGIGVTYVLISGLLGVSAFASSRLRIVTSERLGRGGPKAMFASLREGLVYAVQRPPIRGVLILSLAFFTLGMAWMQVFAPFFADDVLDIGAAGLGLLVGTSGIGAVIATLIIATLRPQRLGAILPLVVFSMGAILVFFSLSTYLPRPLGLIIPFIIMMGVGAMQTSFMSLSNATLLTAAPEEMRGRVISLLSLDRAMVTAGASLGGLLTAAQGVQIAQIVYGALTLTCGLLVFAFARDFRAYRVPGELPDKAIGVPTKVSASTNGPSEPRGETARTAR